MGGWVGDSDDTLISVCVCVFVEIFQKKNESIQNAFPKMAVFMWKLKEITDFSLYRYLSE